MPPQLFLTSFLNHYLAGPVDAVLALLHITPHYPQSPIPNSVAMELIVFVLLLIILLANLLGLLSPWLESPTASVAVPLGLALVTFVYYHYHGVRANGFGYIKQFLGPVWWLYPLLFPIEVISHCARVLSLTVRLYANMFAGDLLTLAFFSLVPIGVPLLFLGLHLGVAVIQAYVFMLLAAIYLSLAVAHEH